MFGISCTGRDRSDINQTKIYYDTCEKNLKERYNNHTTSSGNKSKKKYRTLKIYLQIEN